MTAPGDYVTSPETHPAFGFLLARWLYDAWQRIDQPAEWTIVEVGAGTGRLAEQILSAAPCFSGSFGAALRYRIVEPDPKSCTLQAGTLAEHARRVAWTADIESIARAPIAGCVLSNEFLDALPVHRVIRQGRTLRELWVVEREGILTEEPRAASTPELGSYFRVCGFLPPRGVAVEVNLEAPRWIVRAAGCLSQGYVLTLDYGGTAEELYRLTRSGTLRAYHRHSVCDDPFRRIGEQDLTADVDFSALIRAGETAGLVTRELTTQNEFLTRLAWSECTEGYHVRFLDAPRRPQALLELVDFAELGNIRVLVQEKAG
jgi:SAM-dependent MidA family methyltransferase